MNIKNIIKSFSKEEKILYGSMSKSEQENFIKNRMDKKESGRTVDEDDITENSDKFSDESFNENSDKNLDSDLECFEEDKIFNEIFSDNLDFKEFNEEHENNVVENTIKYDSDLKYDEKSEYKNYEKQTDNNFETKNNIYNDINLVFAIDTTFSFSKIFKAVYASLNTVMNLMKNMKAEHPSLRIGYGLTLFGESIEQKKYNGSYFTNDEYEFLESLKNIVFFGGSSDGKENINEGIEMAIRTVENYSDENTNRGIIVLTDSMPENIKPDFRVLDNCKNRGLRFAVVYANTNKYIPAFKLIDGEGDITENHKNTGDIMSIENILTFDGAEKMKELVARIMYQTSVNH